MGWRTVVIDSLCKLSCKNGYLFVQGEEVTMVHIGEIDAVVVATTQATITAYTLMELIKNKVRVVFCDEKRNPYGEICSYYGAHNSSKKIRLQCRWSDELKSEMFRRIVTAKIANQAAVLKQNGFEAEAKELKNYLSDVAPGDVTNREGLAAKIYFRALFGEGFSRELNSEINAALNYGYSVLLSAVNREIVLNGCITQMGLKHMNEFNPYNLASDLMEPFRAEVDKYVYNRKEEAFDKDYKYKLQALMRTRVKYCGEERTLGAIVAASVKSVIDGMNSGDLSQLKMYEL